MNKAQACTIVMNIFDDRYSEEDKLEACRVVCSMNTNSILRKGDYFSALKWVVERTSFRRGFSGKETFV